jgi:D-beta-D-heptose 7-phosphate kinase/D-beta-D-heptose 1-phosphate adenosyltransferase
MSKHRHLIPSVERLNSAVVACVGDIMLDRFIYGDVSRISPEAPIPVLRIQSEQSMLGGLGNVVRNLGALGCCMKVFSVTGADAVGREVADLLQAVPNCEVHLLPELGRKTPLKARYIAGSQQLLRADDETVHTIGADALAGIVAAFESSVSNCSAVVLSDYAKGVVSNGLAAALIGLARRYNKPVVVDPKGHDYSRYRQASLIKPNLKELAEASGLPVNNTEEQEVAARRLIETTGAGCILVTRGRAGMLLVASDGPPVEFPALAREVYDVSGAGDTVASALAAALGSGAALADAVAIANIAAGIVVGKRGTAVVDRSEIVHEIEHESALKVGDKILRPEEAKERSAIWKRMGFRVGLVFGVFDRISPADLALLENARSQCDRLIVALRSDSSLAALGAQTPMQDQATRAYAIASTVFADAVLVYPDQTVEALLIALTVDAGALVLDVGFGGLGPYGRTGPSFDMADRNLGKHDRIIAKDDRHFAITRDDSTATPL